jgi:hypothetical protein
MSLVAAETSATGSRCFSEIDRRCVGGKKKKSIYLYVECGMELVQLDKFS